MKTNTNAKTKSTNWPTTDEIELRDAIIEMLVDNAGIRHAETFDQAGVFTHDTGLVATASCGRKFQITIVRSK